jgi:uncharacterized RDD family membrane protein YckC
MHPEESVRKGAAAVSYAGVGIRFFAVFIDAIVFFVLGFVVALLSGGTYATSAEGQASAGFALGGGSFVVWAVLGLAYYVVMEAMAGGSIGKLVAGLRVVDEDGCAISWGQSVVRNLLRLVDALFFYVVAALFVSSSPRRQRLGDRAASTFVVHAAR